MGSIQADKGENAFNAFLDHCANLIAGLGKRVWKNNCIRKFLSQMAISWALPIHISHSHDLSPLTRFTTATGTKRERAHCSGKVVDRRIPYR